MNIEQVKNLLELLSKLDTNNKTAETHKIHNGEEVRIVILQRGWVVIGRFYQNGHDCWIEKGYVIRSWGTTKGLGQLAIEGKQTDTVLDPVPLMKFHELTIVASMICDKEKWKHEC